MALHLGTERSNQIGKEKVIQKNIPLQCGGHSGPAKPRSFWQTRISSSLDALCLALPRKLPGTLASQSWSVQTGTMIYVVSFLSWACSHISIYYLGNNTKADTCTSLSQNLCCRIARVILTLSFPSSFLKWFLPFLSTSFIRVSWVPSC